MTDLVGLFGLSLVLGVVIWLLSRSLFEAPVLQRRNYRGVDVPVAAGVAAVATVITTEAVLRLFETDWRTVGSGEVTSRVVTLVVVLGFGLLGAFDDVAAHGEDRGFRGHLTAMARGRLSTGGLKLVAGGLLAVIAVSLSGEDRPGDLLLGAVVVALAANLGNLFDRAPGRTTKVGLLCGFLLVATATTAERPLLGGTVIVLGAAAALLVPDLREQLMLGDAGSNVIGATLGIGLVMTSGTVTRAVAALVLLALNLISEKVSFSRVIDRVAPLRALDRLGRRPA